MPGMTLTALGDKLYVLRDDIADKYLALPLDGNLVRSSTAMFGGRPIPLPQLALRAGRSLQEYVDAFDTGLAADLEVRSVEPATINGKSMQQLRLASPGVSLNALVDPATRLLSALELVASDVKVDFAFETKVLPSAAGAVVFTPGSRAAVESLNELQPQPPRPGDAAPDFSLTALDGKVIDLKSLAGNVVVLDFWATWCPPCRRGLPLLQEFADWAKAEGKAVKVVAVNVWQREQGAEAQRAAVEAFWKEKGYSIPVVMDLKASLADAYLFSSIPQTVIIDPNGVIVAMHSGFRPDLVNMLKEHVAKAMAPAG
jgi:thiol-disulfide isomerase/thioredoxin